jgi:hypothetical protein
MTNPLSCGFTSGPVLHSLAAFAQSDQTLEEEVFEEPAGASVLFSNYDLLWHDFPAQFGCPQERAPDHRRARDGGAGPAQLQRTAHLAGGPP